MSCAELSVNKQISPFPGQEHGSFIHRAGELGRWMVDLADWACLIYLWGKCVFGSSAHEFLFGLSLKLVFLFLF